MKKFSFSKFALLLPAIAFALSSCGDDQKPYLGADFWGFATQIEYPTGSGDFAYAPDIRAYTYTTSDVLKPFFKKNGSLMESDSPFRDAYETLMPLNYESSLTALNGTYSFEATNTEGRTVSQNFVWSFPGTGPVSYQQFTEAWGENPDKKERDEAAHYTKFEYRNGVVQAIIKPFANEGDGALISYAIMYARFKRIAAGSPNGNPITDPGSYRLSRVAGGYPDPFTPSSTLVQTPGATFNLSLPIANTSDNDYTQVALVAFKKVFNADGAAGIVMMRTEYKTIRNGMSTFMEDSDF